MTAKPKQSAKEHGDWRTKLYEQDVTYWTDDDLVHMLTDRYAMPVIPPCRVCGRELSIQRAGSGPTVYACSGFKDGATHKDRSLYHPGRSPADDHYRQSEYVDHLCGGDAVVMELIERFQKKDK